eukprot:2759051-Karenia_brevis.AAC.1
MSLSMVLHLLELPEGVLERILYHTDLPSLTSCTTACLALSALDGSRMIQMLKAEEEALLILGVPPANVNKFAHKLKNSAAHLVLISESPHAPDQYPGDFQSLLNMDLLNHMLWPADMGTATMSAWESDS